MSKKPKFELRQIIVDFGIYDFKAYVVFGSMPEAYRFVAYVHECTGVEELSEDTVGYGARGKFFHRPGYCPVVWMPQPPQIPEEYATLTHEGMHLIRVLMARTGIPLTADTDEAYAHALDYFVKTVLESPISRA